MDLSLYIYLEGVRFARLYPKLNLQCVWFMRFNPIIRSQIDNHEIISNSKLRMTKIISQINLRLYIDIIFFWKSNTIKVHANENKECQKLCPYISALLVILLYCGRNISSIKLINIAVSLSYESAMNNDESLISNVLVISLSE